LLINLVTLRLHYNAVLYNAESVLTQSPRGSQILFENEINTVNRAAQLFNQHTPIDTAIYKLFVCYNYKTKYTD